MNAVAKTINIRNNNYILIDRFKRNSYVKLEFKKEKNQLYFAGVLEKYSIPYSGGIVYDPDIIMLSTIHYLQIRELIQCRRTKLWGDFSILGYCSIDYVNNVEIPFKLTNSLNHYKTLQNYIICNEGGTESYWVDLSKGKSKYILRKEGTGSVVNIDQILPEHVLELPFSILCDLQRFDVLCDEFSETKRKKYYDTTRLL